MTNFLPGSQDNSTLELNIHEGKTHILVYYLQCCKNVIVDALEIDLKINEIS